MQKNDSIVKEVIKRLFKKVRPSTILILAILLSGNVFAWFIYTTKVESRITAHVKAWNIDFVVGNTSLSQQINFDVSNLYPGMSTYTENITATNTGETSATFSYEIISATILGTTYTPSNSLTNDDLIDMLENDYPFSIVLNSDNTLIDANGGTGMFTLTVSWPYESGDDVADTYWGGLAYDYNSNNPDLPSVSILIEITATQVE